MARKKKSKAKSKSRPRVDDEDDDLDDEIPPPPKKKAGPRSDAYVGMLAVSFVALLVAATFLYMDFDGLGGQQVSPPVVSVPPLGAAAATPAPR